MCGLGGYLNLSKSVWGNNDALLYEMQQSMAHRGPNGWRTWISDQHAVALVHRRLSIIDLSNDAFQPMLDATGRIAVCFNGEIYNHPFLRILLESRGHRYRTQSDTETIIHAYKEWGIDFLHHLNGMFSIALFDMESNELYLMRDRIGIKPLYFSLLGDMLSFASEIKALWPLPWIEKSINQTAISHYLTYMVTPAPMTLYKGIYKLPAGFYIKVDAQREVTFCQWYDPVANAQQAPKEFLNDEQACIEHIRSLLRTSIKQQMVADVPLGIFLSGGIDSSLNVALMAEQTDNIKTFNVAFRDGPECNETQWARMISKRFNTQHYEITISEKEAFDFFKKMVYHQDEPIGDCVCIPLYYVSKLLHDTGVTVVQVGEGSDELFCGYSSYGQYLKTYRLWHPSQRYIPSFARKAAYTAAAPFYQHRRNRLDIMRNWAGGKELFSTGSLAFSEVWKKDFLYTVPLEPDPIIEKIYPGLAYQYGSYGFAEYHRAQLQQHDPHADEFKIMSYLELKQRLPELLLMRVDKMAMATSVEGRVPFLDHELVEFVLQIPTHMKYKNGITKYILKKACEGILPHEIIYRKKIGFAAPTKRWFKQGNYFLPYFKNMLQNNAKNNYACLDLSAINSILTQHQTTKADHACQLWVLQNLIACMEQS